MTNDDLMTPAVSTNHAPQDGDPELLARTAAAVRAAGTRLLDRFDVGSRPGGAAELVAALNANDEAVLALLRPMLEQARPGAGWVEDELDTGPLPTGEWWVTDPAEGNINHIHGLPEWGVTAALVRDNRVVLAAVYVPLADQLYTAIAGGGAFVDGQRLQVSTKPTLDGAYVGTGQARPGEDIQTHRRIGASITAMLDAALLVRSAVPATMTLIQVAAGRMDAFWQFSGVLSGLVSGALLVGEAGGVVTDTDGAPWSLGSAGLLATTPPLHADTVGVLAQIR